MLWRALLAFLALPGVVAIAIPTLFATRVLRAGGAFHPVGLLPLVAGLMLLLWCVRDFYVSGKGTLAPWSPPKYLVTGGLYRFSRNPMYVGVALMLFGEEPWLARTHGAAWDEYRARVPRWLL